VLFRFILEYVLCKREEYLIISGIEKYKLIAINQDIRWRPVTGPPFLLYHFVLRDSANYWMMVLLVYYVKSSFIIKGNGLNNAAKTNFITGQAIYKKKEWFFL
jgi:hypothetical protein